MSQNCPMLVFVIIARYKLIYCMCFWFTESFGPWNSRISNTWPHQEQSGPCQRYHFFFKVVHYYCCCYYYLLGDCYYYLYHYYSYKKLLCLPIKEKKIIIVVVAFQGTAIIVSITNIVIMFIIVIIFTISIIIRGLPYPINVFLHVLVNLFSCHAQNCQHKQGLHYYYCYYFWC